MIATNIRNLLLLSLTLLVSPAEAQYGYGYGYNNSRSGWRNIYIVAIIVPIVIIILCILFWFCVFKAIFRRRRQARNDYALPQNTGYTGGGVTTYPGQSSYGQSNTQYGEQIQPPPMMHQPSNNYGNHNGASYPGGTSPSQYAPPAGPPPKSKWRM